METASALASQVYYSNIPFSIADVPARKEPAKVLLCSPEYFDIVDEKNVHMQGQMGNMDKNKATAQWNALKEIYEGLQDNGMLQGVGIVAGAPDCEDMVFCANQSFPWQMEDGRRVVVMSRMRHASRQREVKHFEAFYKQAGYELLYFTKAVTFEGMGDVIPHPNKRLLYGGYGYRTAADAYSELAQMLQTPVVALELVNPKFYHLDTCFVPLSEKAVMLCKEAFTEEGLQTIAQLFEKIYYIPGEEADEYFSLNAHVLNLGGKRTAILHPGSTETKQALQAEGYTIIETDTSEYMKSGGSVFCMKMMYY